MVNVLAASAVNRGLRLDRVKRNTMKFVCVASPTHRWCNG
jgi:hypothetical protein